ncbi:hypothetical protein SS50377_25716 [Spironucleus salmonicida]|uniref:Uncharacterized protein n=1 Tax=Spironucleus salmonicida TaxID=348837 RepID=V6LEJ5_9EUKA|nr:hypothetical protein SS50377_25716 [Spironucleus salmonicida]|eukprot:EST42673.1 Hypothetical protein SS50377_17690 [Spironucleus salmonicida]
MESLYQEKEVMQFQEYLALWKAIFKKQDPYSIVNQFDRSQKHLQLRNKLGSRVIILEAPVGSGMTTFLTKTLTRFQFVFESFDGSVQPNMFDQALTSFIDFRQGIIRKKRPHVLIVENPELLQLNKLAFTQRMKDKRHFFIIVLTSNAFSSSLRQLRQNSILLRFQVSQGEVKKILQTYAPGGIISTQLLQKQFAENLSILNKFTIQDICSALLTRKQEFLLQKRDIPQFQAYEVLKKQHIFTDYGTAISFIQLGLKLGITNEMALKSLEKASHTIFELPFLSTFQSKAVKANKLNYQIFEQFENQFCLIGEIQGIIPLSIIQNLSNCQSQYDGITAIYSVHSQLQQTSFVKPSTCQKIYFKCQFPIFTGFEIRSVRKLNLQSLLSRVLYSFSASSIFLSLFDLQIEFFKLLTQFSLQNYVGTLSDLDKNSIATSSTSLAELGFLRDKNGFLVLSDELELSISENAKRALIAAVDGLFSGNKLSEEIFQLVMTRFSEKQEMEICEQEYTFNQGVTLAVRILAKFQDFFQ